MPKGKIEMTSDPIELLKAALGCRDAPEETVATQRVAQKAKDKDHHVWAPTFGRQYKLKNTYDVSWGVDSGTPKVLVQMKTGGRHQENQEVLEFLSDVVHAAFDKSKDSTAATFLCCAVLQAGTQYRLHWPQIMKLTGNVALEMSPADASNKAGPKIQNWVDVQAGLLRPSTRTQCAQILTGTQRSNLVGAFKRSGTLRVQAVASPLPKSGSRGFDMLVWEVGTITLTGTTIALEEWLP